MGCIGYLAGTFIENESTSNEQYFQSKWVFPVEAYGNIIQPKDMQKPVYNRILCDKKTQAFMQNLVPNKHYKLTVGFSVQKANTGKDGKTYPPKVNFNVLSVAE